MRRRSDFWFYLLFFIFALAGCLFVLVVPHIWHAKFYIDGLTLVDSEPRLELFGNSYNGTAFIFAPAFWFLRSIGVNLSGYGLSFNAEWYFVNLVWASFFLVSLAYLQRSLRLPLTWPGICLLGVSVFLYAPFYASINKEIVPFVLCVITVVAAARGSLRSAIVFCCVSFLLYGLFVRSYFMVIALLIIGSWSIGRVPYRLLGLYIVGVACVLAVYSKLPHDLIESGRAEYLIDVTATRISYLWSDGNALGFVGNRVLAFFRISFPLELLALSPAYGAFVVFKCYASILVARAFLSTVDPRVRFFCLCLFAYSAVQALFEPDFGSVFRHFMSVLPFVLAIYTVEWRLERGLPISRGRFV